MRFDHVRFEIAEGQVKTKWASPRSPPKQRSFPRGEQGDAPRCFIDPQPVRAAD